jgi:pimeloyl-ACP methyl ester carboxylesterase
MAALLGECGSIVDSLDQSRIHFVDVDGIRTRYYEDGQGEPLVLIHGGDFGSLYSLDAWSLNLPALARRFHVYAFDKLGQGHTDAPRGETDYSTAALLAHARGLFETLGIRQANVAGHSRGGSLATWLALDHPNLVRRLIVVDSATTAPDDPDYPLGVFYARLGHPDGVAEPTLDSVRIEPDAQAFNPAQITDDFLARMLEVARLPSTRAAQQTIVRIRQSHWLPDLHRKRAETLDRLAESGVSMPTLLVWGYNDRSGPLPLGLRLFDVFARKTARLEMHLLHGAGHYSFRDQSEAFNRAVAGFCLFEA